jgi:phosphoenolpyruvate carboxylase
MATLLSRELKDLVRDSVQVLGEVIAAEWGTKTYLKIEGLRKKMRVTRGLSHQRILNLLEREYTSLKAERLEERQKIAHSFAIILELMNACEAAYRSHRIRERRLVLSAPEFERLIYVLTAHPTEARCPEILELFGKIRVLLQDVITGGWGGKKDELRILLSLALRVSMARQSKPKLRDEAEMIFTSLLRPEILDPYFDLVNHGYEIRFRTWVGGDKDGHPGVSKTQMLQSLQASRRKMLHYVRSQLASFENELKLLPSSERKPWMKKLKTLTLCLSSLRLLTPGDSGRLKVFHQKFDDFFQEAEKSFHAVSPFLSRIKALLRVYGGILIPLELRESSDMIAAGLKKPAALNGMLKMLGRLSRGGQIQWYARGLVVSMTESVEDLDCALRIQIKILKKASLPVVPLFETAEGLQSSPEIMRALLKRPLWKRSSKHWIFKDVEVMLGYSDSSKQSGALFSRVLLAQTIGRLDHVIHRAGLKPLYFHGSGGSVERGGGSIREQTDWWPVSARRNIKFTVQGEMVQRSLASPEILMSQINQYSIANREGLKRPTPVSQKLQRFANETRKAYKALIEDERFLQHVSRATPYSYLRWLHLGSRPSARKKTKSITSLRAIPWILCWTQTRLLLPAWWGIGQAWSNLSKAERIELRKEFQRSALLRSFIKNLGFSLAKVEFGLWRLYQEKFDPNFPLITDFEKEFQSAVQCVRFLSGERNLLWFRPWLGESIYLRSSVIHPLNILQVIAMEKGEPALLRETVTGISSGMMTTG